MSSPLTIAAWLSVGASVACLLIVTVHLALGNSQRMWIMNVVWPVTMLWAGPLGLWAYFRWGVAGSRRAGDREGEPPNRRQPFPVLVAKAATHCGSGCTLGDLVAETIATAIPFVLFGETIFGTWVYDFVLAYLFGIAFQYFTIKPMRGVSAGRALVAAVKADTLSLVAWQAGMYGWMAIVRFGIVGRELPKGSPHFWFMMQIAMVFGFVTAYPVNWWLLRRGIKEKM